jgi:hypothetical protein
MMLDAANMHRSAKMTMIRHVWKRTDSGTPNFQADLKRFLD